MHAASALQSVHPCAAIECTHTACIYVRACMQGNKVSCSSPQAKPNPLAAATTPCHGQLSTESCVLYWGPCGPVLLGPLQARVGVNHSTPPDQQESTACFAHDLECSHSTQALQHTQSIHAGWRQGRVHPPSSHSVVPQVPLRVKKP